MTAPGGALVRRDGGGYNADRLGLLRGWRTSSVPCTVGDVASPERLLEVSSQGRLFQTRRCHVTVYTVTSVWNNHVNRGSDVTVYTVTWRGSVSLP
jgi:hypothetical protein